MLQMMDYDLLIFDLDGTLFDYQATEMQAITSSCISIGISYSNEVYALYKKANSIAKNKVPNYINQLGKFREIRAELFLESLNIDTIWKNKFLETYMIASRKGVLLSEVEKTIKLLSQYRKVIGTNGSTHPRLDKLQNSSIYSEFCAFYSSEELGVSKPNPSFFNKILNQQRTKKNKALYIGDNWEVDIVGANTAGIDACYINSNNQYCIEEKNFVKTISINYISQLVEVLNEKVYRI